jgi:TetR/AcrR family transcriptional repressor of mexJK operon
MGNVGSGTEMTAGKRRLRRPTEAEAVELEQRLRHAALKLFLAPGYDGTIMEAVAREAGITERTLYPPDRRAVFRAITAWAQRRLAWDEPALDDPDYLDASLTAIARSAVARVLDPDVVGLNRWRCLRHNGCRSWSPSAGR